MSIPRMHHPYVTAIMPTSGVGLRRQFARTAIRAFREQTYPNRKLLVLNHGIEPLLRPDAAHALGVREIMVQRPATLGELRNMAFDFIDTPWAITWDDDDWHSPYRIRDQMDAVKREGAIGCALTRYAVVNLDGAEIFVRCCRTFQCGCCIGTMLFRVGLERYPAVDRGEDTGFAKSLRQSGELARLNNDPLLYLRTCHSENTSGRGHVMRPNTVGEPITPSQIETARRITREAFGWYKASAPAAEDSHARPFRHDGCCCSGDAADPSVAAETPAGPEAAGLD